MKSVEQNEDSEESARIAKIDAMFKADKKKYDKVRKVLASRNQDIARIRRKMDGYPSRAELLQYEKRFVELYAQVNISFYPVENSHINLASSIFLKVVCLVSF